MATLRAAGCVAAEEEALDLVQAAAGDAARLRHLVERRLTGEPPAWIVGSVQFCGLTIAVHAGVYVPRPQTEPLARRAAALLPGGGLAVDLCTGSGAVAVTMAFGRPDATVLATELDPVAAACARANGVRVHEGDLDAGLPGWCCGQVDVVTAVPPYVPTEAMHLLPRDVVAHEPALALDGGPHGTAMLVRAAEVAARLLRPGGWLLLELGGDQADLLEPVLHALGYVDLRRSADEEGDLRALEARRRGLSRPPHRARTPPDP